MVADKEHKRNEAAYHLTAFVQRFDRVAVPRW